MEMVAPDYRNRVLAHVRDSRRAETAYKMCANIFHLGFRAYSMCSRHGRPRYTTVLLR